MSHSNFTNWSPSFDQEQGSNISSKLLEDGSYSNSTNWAVSSEAEDPRVAATSYMIYKIGEFIYLNFVFWYFDIVLIIFSYFIFLLLQGPLLPLANEPCS